MLKILFNTLLGLVLIFIWSRFVNLQEIWLTLAKVNLIYLGPVVFFLLLSQVLRAVRLQIFLSEIKKIKLLDLIFLNGVSQILNFFIPIRAGEVAKGVYLNTRYQLPLGKSVVWIFLDRFVDFLAVLLLASILFFIVPTTLSFQFVTVVAIIFLAALFLTYLIIHQQNLARKVFRFLRYLLIFKSIAIYFDRFSNFILDSFTILDRHPKDLILMSLVTILAYGADAGIWYFTFVSLGVYQEYFKMYLGQLLSALTYLIPAAPGYVGSAEASGTLILSGIFGVSANLASAMLVLLHVVLAIFVLVFGIISLYSLKIDLKVIFKKVLNREKNG